MLCKARDLALLVQGNPFAGQRLQASVVRFVGVLTKRLAKAPKLPTAFPPAGEWFVRVIGCKGQFVFGVYRRHMKTIGYLGRIDRLLGAPVTIRNWNTIATIAKISAGERLGSGEGRAASLDTPRRKKKQ